MFSNTDFGNVRTIEVNNKILFCGSDVAKALGYSNPRDALIRHCKGVVKHDGVSNTTNQHGKTTQQITEMSFITEGDIYRLIIKSKLPLAEKFESWIFDEVLPEIRKNGTYVTNQMLNEMLGSPDFAIRLFTEIKTEREKTKELTEMNKQNVTRIEKLQPKASYCELVLQSSNSVPITIIAKDYGMSAVKFNLLLSEIGVQHKIDVTWVLNQKYADRGYTQSKTHITDSGKAIVHTHWTQKGRRFLYEHLKSKYGITPTVEIESLGA